MPSMPWKRNKGNSTGAKVPAEVEQYYESSRKERVGIAWLLALATLLLTILIAAALFFAGRWAFNKVFNNDTDERVTPTVVEEVPSDQSGPDSQADTDGSESAGGNQSEGGSQPTSPSPSDSDSSPQTPSPQNQPQTTTPQTGGEEIPRTGPDSEE